MADLFKLAGRDVRVAEADNVLNTQANSIFNSVTAANIANSILLAADENGKIIPSTISALDKGNASTNDNQVIYNPVELKKGLTGAGAFAWSKTAYGETGTTQILDGCRLVLTQGYNSPSIDFSTRNTTTPYLSSITTTSISFANDSIYPSILWNSNVPNMSGKPFFLTSDLLGKNNYIAQLDDTGRVPAAQLPSNLLYKGDRDSATNQIIYNPVELKKPLVAPSIQSPKYTDKSGAQHSLFELGGTHSVDNGVSSGYGSLTLYRDRDGTWDSTSISYTLAEGLKIGDYGIGGPLSNNGYAIATKYLMTNQDRVITQDINGRVRVKAGDGVSSDDFVFESVYNGKLHSKMSVGPTGLVRGGWCINDKKIATVDVVRSTRDTLANHITAQAGGWIWLGKVAEKTYSLDLSEIKPGASGTTTGATCYVSINTFQQTVEGATQYKTVIDATCRCEPFELKHLDVKVLLSNVGSKWFMPRMFVSRGAMASDAFTHMMAILYEDRVRVGMTVDECSVFRDMTTALGTLNASGSVSPIYGMNADGFTLFATIMELDRDNENQNIPVSGAHYRVTIFHPRNVL